MGVYLGLDDFDEEFARLDINPEIINDYNTSIPEERERLNRFLYTHYRDTDTIEQAAACHCGELTGVYRIGIVCTVCGTPVQSTTNKPIESMVWLRAPEGVPTLFHPEAWVILENALKVKDFNFLEYLTHTSYSYDPDKGYSKETRKKIDRLMRANLPRGFNNFVAHFDGIIKTLFDEGILADSNKTNKAELWAFIQQNKHLFFPKHLPVPSRICFVVESTTSGTYIDNPLSLAMDAIETIASVREKTQSLPSYQVQNRVVKTIKQLATFYDVYTKQRLAQKPGMFRRHVFGSRLNFSARAVITSISDPHDYDELHIPWGLATQLLKYHIIAKLLRRGYSANEALQFVYANVLHYNQELDQIFQELIAEAPGGGIACIFSRNPTLQRGSTQQFRITRVKTDPNINTVSMSVLVLKAPNRLTETGCFCNCSP